MIEDPTAGVGELTRRRPNAISGLRVAVLYNLKENAPSVNGVSPADALDELDTIDNVNAYAAAIEAAGHTVVRLEGDARLARELRRHNVDLCFNTCEGFHGDAREAQVPSLLEMLGIPYTAGRVTALTITLDKALTKRVLASHGLPTPRFQEFLTPDDPLDPGLRFPLFVKPNHEGTAIGITAESRVANEAELRARVAYLIERYQQRVLVEEYIPGREVTCGLVGNLPRALVNAPVPADELYSPDGMGVDWNGLHLFPISELDFSGYPPGTERFYSNKLKVALAENYHSYCPAPIPDDIAAEVRRLTIETFRATRCFDISRVDFRLDERNGLQPHILEINALPGMGTASDLVLCAEAEGWTHADVIVAVVDAAVARCDVTAPAPRRRRRKPAPARVIT
ncbi:MAG: hypothetical protein ACE5FI_09605 [Anaerolineales bacterium]